MALAVPAAPVFHLVRQRAQRAQLLVRVAHPDRLAVPFRTVPGLRRQLPRTRLQRVRQHDLLLPVPVGDLAVGAGAALARPQLDPVRGTVARAPETAGTDERLGDEQGVPPGPLPVVAEPPQVQARHARRQVRHAPPLREDEEPRVIADRMQAAVLHRPVPAEPLVARGAREGPRLPAEQGQPATVPCGDIAQPAPGELLETQTVPLIHQIVPAPALVGKREAHRHLLQHRRRKGGRRNRRARGRSEDSFRPAGCARDGGNGNGHTSGIQETDEKSQSAH